MENQDKESNFTPTVNTEKIRSCASDACKGFLYVFNFFFGVSGIVAIAICGWMLRHGVSMDLSIIMDSQLYRLGGIIIVISGCAMAIISVVGICGVRQENKCFMLGYIVTLIVLVCFVFVAGVLSVRLYTKAENELEFLMLNTLTREYGPGGNEKASDPMTSAWNNLQESYNCCGVKTNTSGSRLYKRSTIWYREQPIVLREKVPPACCIEVEEGEYVDLKNCQNIFSGYENVYEKGCYDAALGTIAMYCTLVSGCAVGITGILLIGLVLSYVVTRQM